MQYVLPTFEFDARRPAVALGDVPLDRVEDLDDLSVARSEWDCDPIAALVISDELWQK